MYRNGQFHIPDGSKACASVMRRDFEYWGLDELDLEACCALKYYPDIEVCRVQKEKEIEENQRPYNVPMNSSDNTHILKYDKNIPR